ncbi:uncharacterized protein PV06_02873 [Exophiala oligosperma]|uniref:Uncharacterized protein n=1 Tax=Exophiala oligosperma TaxID=215243 RepID=A0A0D2DPG8_9EURO|nr:uncharacterized protein PV06_02873 [Exophiala oligosperma]KIW44400.1 hypothetical protein PV06_02873 [Exophiala oligosperma]
MATPTFIVAPPKAEEIARRLEEEVCRRHVSTPEPVFRKQHDTQSYDYLCEIERKRFKQGEIDDLQATIPGPFYWECEARTLKDLLSEAIWGNIIHKHSMNAVPTTECWRNVVSDYRCLLKSEGYSTQQIREGRFSIKDQRYWKHEAECL